MPAPSKKQPTSIKKQTIDHKPTKHIEIPEATDSTALAIPPSDSLSPREAPAGMNLISWNEVVQSVLSEEQFKIITGKTPAYAIKTRQGGKGAIFRYVPHGYVRAKLNEAFGFDYDFRVLEIESGRKYSIVDRKEKDGEIVQYLVVLGELTIRLHNPKKPLDIIATIVKQDFGSQAWRYSMEIGDALKAASSDALKRCGLGLGIALDLYFDDQAASDHFTKQEAKRMQEALARQVKTTSGSEPPADAMDFLTRAAGEMGLDADQIEAQTGYSIDLLMDMDATALSEVWTNLLIMHTEASQANKKSK